MKPTGRLEVHLTLAHASHRPERRTPRGRGGSGRRGNGERREFQQTEKMDALL